MKPSGTALLQTNGRSGAPGATNRWIRKHIFPGGYIPAASEVLEPLQCSGLRVDDLEVWRMHYAYTLAEWNRRFQAHRARFSDALGERFCRMWEFYLLSCEAAFRRGALVVLQLQMTRDCKRLPTTRGYMEQAPLRA